MSFKHVLNEIIDSVCIHCLIQNYARLMHTSTHITGLEDL